MVMMSMQQPSKGRNKEAVADVGFEVFEMMSMQQPSKGRKKEAVADVPTVYAMMNLNA